MGNNQYKISVPGKLFIAGEYAVLEPDGHCIVAAVDRYVYATINNSAENRIDLPQIGHVGLSWVERDGHLAFTKKASNLTFIQNAIEVCHQYICSTGIDPVSFSLTINSELDDESGKKYGLGSSAAVVTAVITSILRCHEEFGITFTKELIYKLAAIAHFKTQGNGSCADIAASVYGGWLHYSSFHGDWLVDKLKSADPVSMIVDDEWPGLLISQISPPTDLLLCVGWTGSEMKTSGMIVKIQQLKEKQPSAFKLFLETSNSAVTGMMTHFKTGDSVGVLQDIRMNRLALKHLSDASEAGIETPVLQTLIAIADRYGAGKTSGAGGGDCGIAFVQTLEKREALKQEWKQANIEPLNLSVSIDGAVVIEEGEAEG